MPGDGHPVCVDAAHGLQHRHRGVEIGDYMVVVQIGDGLARVFALRPAVMQVRCRRDVAVAGKILHELGSRRVVAGASAAGESIETPATRDVAPRPRGRWPRRRPRSACPSNYCTRARATS